MQRDLSITAVFLQGTLMMLDKFRSEWPASAWDDDLGIAVHHLKEALLKVETEMEINLSFVGGPDDRGVVKELVTVLPFPPADRTMLVFHTLKPERVTDALTAFVNASIEANINLPWSTVDGLDKAIGNGYNPHQHFSLWLHADGTLSATAS